MRHKFLMRGDDMKKGLSYLRNEKGSIVEYVIMLAVIAIIMAVMFPGLRGGLSEKIVELNEDIGISNGNHYLAVAESYEYYQAKSVTFRDDYNIKLKLFDDNDLIISGFSTNYRYDTSEQGEMIKSFIDHGRKGTLTNSPTENSNKIVVLGRNKNEWHYAISVKDVYPTYIELSNGIIINSNEPFEVHVFNSEEERMKLVERLDKKSQQERRLQEEEEKMNKSIEEAFDF